MFDIDELFHHPDESVVEAAYADVVPAADLPPLDDIPPGPVLAALLSVVDGDAMAGDEQLTLLRAQRRPISLRPPTARWRRWRTPSKRSKRTRRWPESRRRPKSERRSISPAGPQTMN